MLQASQRLPSFLFFVILLLVLLGDLSVADEPTHGRYLYVASPGVRNYLEWGGHGILVYAIDDNHRLIKRISLDGFGLNETGQVLNVKGVCASAANHRIYVSTLRQLICVDLLSEKVLWQKAFDLGCDRMSISPDGKVIYLPSLEKESWYVVDAETGDEVKRLSPKSKSHNTVYGLSGDHVYLAGLGSPLLSVSETRTHTITQTVGPFSDSIRPFTVNGSETLVFVNVNNLLGFEIGDLKTGKKLHRVEVQGVPHGQPKRHGCPSHGIGLTPDEKEIWVCDGFNSQLHIFDATEMPPVQKTSITLREQPGWVTFTLDGQYAYPSTGEVIDTVTKKIITTLADEEGRQVHSEKLLEIDFKEGKPTLNGDQFGLGRVR